MPESATAAHDGTPLASPRWDEGGVADSSISHITPEDMEADYDSGHYSDGDGDDDDEDVGDDHGRAHEIISNDEGPSQSYVVYHERLGIRAMARYERVLLVPQPQEVSNRVPCGNLKKIVIEANEEDHLCAICLEDMDVGSEACSLECAHKYHEACIIQWLEKKLVCPLCRSKI